MKVIAPTQKKALTKAVHPPMKQTAPSKKKTTTPKGPPVQTLPKRATPPVNLGREDRKSQDGASAEHRQLTWLHLSDLHFGQHQREGQALFDERILTAKLLEDTK